jgi:hypothetical protein
MALRPRIGLAGLAVAIALSLVPAAATASTVCPPGDSNSNDCATLPALAVTASADGIRAQTATLHGAVDGFGEHTQYYFQWGQTVLYGSTTRPGALTPCPAAVTNPSACIGVPGTLVASTIKHLIPATTYHFRVLAGNADGTTIGSDRTFTTGPLNPVQYVHATHTIGPGGSFNIAVRLRVAARLTIRVLNTGGLVVSTTRVEATKASLIGPRLPSPALPGAYSISVTAVGGGTTQTLGKLFNVV